MKTYQKKAPKIKRPQKNTPVPPKKAARSNSKIAALASTAYFKVASAFAPLNKFQQALTYTGVPKKETSFSKWLIKNNVLLAVVEKILVIAFAVFALITNPYLLLILPAIGALVFYRNRVKWLWWKLKVFVLHRNYYAHRRQLYKQGTLYYHLLKKRPKKYKNAIIWGESGTIQDIKFRALQKSNSLTKKEYISL